MWTRDSGPAVVGLVMSRIALPAWVAGAGRARQELILEHEEEHLRAHDVQLRFFAALLLFAFPWNPALWIQYHRLGLAVELDCDRRVMHRWPNRRRLYSDLLLQVGTRGRAIPAMAVAALAERRSLLEQRIRKLLSKAPEVRMAQAAFLAFGAILVVGVAVLVPGIARDRGPEVREVPADAEAMLEDVSQSLDRLEERIEEGRQQSELKLPPPPEEVETDMSAKPVWTNVDTYPDLKNRDEMAELLRREYPPLLRDAGIGGTTKVWFFINEAGEVVKTQVHTSAGHAALDEAARRVGSQLEFSPATNAGEAVPLWVALDIKFESR